MKKFKIVYLLLVSIFISSQILWAIEAGVSRLEITPRTGLKMAGFGARKSPSSGVLDPLYVRALVFRQQDRKVAFVVYDLLYPFGREIGDELRRRILDKTGIEEVIFAATHTHSGPSINSAPRIEDGDRIDGIPEFERFICQKTVQAVKNAFDSLQPVKIGAGRGSADVTYNRIKVNPDGTVKMIWENHDKIPLGPVDQTVGVVKIEDLQGKTIAVLVNYACHPVIYGSDNLMYSADFPGVLCRLVQENMEGNPLCIFFNGAIGELNPYYAAAKDNPSAKVEEVGKVLANEVVRVAGNIATKPCDEEGSIVSKVKYYQIEGRWDTELWNSFEEDAEKKKVIADIAEKENNLQLPLSVVLITPEIGFVGLPGEFFSKFQWDIREQSPVDFLIVAGYTNGSFGYFPTISAAVDGGYGANDQATHTRVGTGERFVIEAIVSLNELLGLLRPVPADPEKGYRY